MTTRQDHREFNNLPTEADFPDDLPLWDGDEPASERDQDSGDVGTLPADPDLLLDRYEEAELEALDADIEEIAGELDDAGGTFGAEEEQIDFWQGMDPNGFNRFDSASVGDDQEFEEELAQPDEEIPAYPVAPPIAGAAVAAGVAVAAASVSKETTDGAKAKVASPTRPRRRAEDYQMPKISWLSQKKRGAKIWGYGFILGIIFTIFGSVTLVTYLILLNSKVSVPTVVVNVSIISLLFFLLLLVFRYVALIYMSFLHISQSKEEEFDEVNMQLKASILIPAYNEEKGIEESIKSMLELDYDNYEIIVINDGSKDNTLEVARKWEGWHGNVLVKVISQRNMGKANALNYGVNNATGDIVICVDGDSKLHPASLRLGMRHFGDPKISAVAGNVKVINRRNMLTYLQALEYIEGLNLVRRAQALMHAVNIIPGPLGFFRRNVVMEVGGWDDDTFAEDCDLTLKILTKKHRIDYEPGAISYTEAPEELLQLLKQRYRWTRGILQSMRKHSIYLLNPASGWRVLVTMWQMIFEAVLWPLMNVTANILFLLVALIFGMSPLIVFWWVQLTMLDTLAAMHTVAIERESIKLVPFAIIYRAVFIQLVDVAKLIATFEELMGVQMSWGHMERQGRLGPEGAKAN